MTHHLRRTFLIPLLLLLLALAGPIPTAEAQGGYSVSFEAPVTLLNPGNGVTAIVMVTKDGSGVANARLTVGSQSVLTNGTGQAQVSFFEAGVVRTETRTAHLVEVLTPQGYQPASAPDRSLTVSWTRLNLSLTSDGTVPTGGTGAFVVGLVWAHNGSAAGGVRVRVTVGSEPSLLTTGPNGSARLSFTRGEATTLWANATILPADRPYGIAHTSPPAASLRFASASAGGGGPGPSGDPDPSASAPSGTDSPPPATSSEAPEPGITILASTASGGPGPPVNSDESTPGAGVASLLGAAALVAGWRRLRVP